MSNKRPASPLPEEEKQVEKKAHTEEDRAIQVVQGEWSVMTRSQGLRRVKSIFLNPGDSDIVHLPANVFQSLEDMRLFFDNYVTPTEDIRHERNRHHQVSTLMRLADAASTLQCSWIFLNLSCDVYNKFGDGTHFCDRVQAVAFAARHDNQDLLARLADIMALHHSRTPPPAEVAVHLWPHWLAQLQRAHKQRVKAERIALSFLHSRRTDCACNEEENDEPERRHTEACCRSSACSAFQAHAPALFWDTLVVLNHNRA